MFVEITNGDKVLCLKLNEYRLNINKEDDSIELNLGCEKLNDIGYKLFGDRRATITTIRDYLLKQLRSDRLLIDEYRERNYLFIGKERMQFSGFRIEKKKA